VGTSMCRCCAKICVTEGILSYDLSCIYPFPAYMIFVAKSKYVFWAILLGIVILCLDVPLLN
jgi:hypothetical protein